jgi:hypothetical protein
MYLIDENEKACITTGEGVSVLLLLLLHLLLLVHLPEEQHLLLGQLQPLLLHLVHLLLGLQRLLRHHQVLLQHALLLLPPLRARVLYLGGLLAAGKTRKNNNEGREREIQWP